jgi:hypothetical protein
MIAFRDVPSVLAHRRSCRRSDPVLLVFGQQLLTYDLPILELAFDHLGN